MDGYFLVNCLRLPKGYYHFSPHYTPVSHDNDSCEKYHFRLSTHVEYISYNTDFHIKCVNV